MIQSKKTRVVKFLCTPDEYLRLKNKAEYSGFLTISQFIRFVVFNDFGIEKMIKSIHDRIVLAGSDKK